MRPGLVLLLLVPFAQACESTTAPAAGVRVEHLFTSPWSVPECMLASPLLGPDGAVVTAAGAALRGADPRSGALLWEIELPAPAGERAFVTGTPALVGETRAVVAYHTTPADATERDVRTTRLRQRVVVVDLQAHAPDAAFAPLDLDASLPGNGGPVAFRPDRQLARPMVVVGRAPGDTLGRAYVTTGNAQDLQPWHGWVFEIDLDAWRGGAPAVRALVTTPEPDCGPEGASGSRTRICGGGLWAPSGPLVRQVGGEDELVLAPGNGQLDLARRDYANTLMRVRRGLAFDPGCDAAACAASPPTEPTDACVATCANLYVPRLDGQPLPRPENGVCDGLTSLYDCWAKLDFQGGSTPVEVPLASGRRPLVYATKDGHAYLVDGDHLGTQHDRLKLVEICGTRDDKCTMSWAGMIVTQPAVLGARVFVPTFMPDETHEAGVFALDVRDETRPRLEVAWRFPAAGSADARQRFRRHPSRPLALTLPSGLETVWLVEAAAPGGRGRLIGLRASDGALLADAPLDGPGYRFTLPLYRDGVLYVPTCGGDQGPGRLEAFQLTPE